MLSTEQAIQRFVMNARLRISALLKHYQDMQQGNLAHLSEITGRIEQLEIDITNAGIDDVTLGMFTGDMLAISAKDSPNTSTESPSLLLDSVLARRPIDVEHILQPSLAEIPTSSVVIKDEEENHHSANLLKDLGQTVTDCNDFKLHFKANDLANAQQYVDLNIGLQEEGNVFQWIRDYARSIFHTFACEGVRHSTTVDCLDKQSLNTFDIQARCSIYPEFECKTEREFVQFLVDHVRLSARGTPAKKQSKWKGGSTANNNAKVEGQNQASSKSSSGPPNLIGKGSGNDDDSDDEGNRKTLENLTVSDPDRAWICVSAL